MAHLKRTLRFSFLLGLSLRLSRLTCKSWAQRKKLRDFQNTPTFSVLLVGSPLDYLRNFIVLFFKKSTQKNGAVVGFSRHLLCSQVASDILRSLCALPLAVGHNTAGRGQLAFHERTATRNTPLKQSPVFSLCCSTTHCAPSRCPFAFGDEYVLPRNTSRSNFKQVQERERI